MISDKVKSFLALKQSEYEKKIIKYKRKNRIIKSLCYFYNNFITSSLVVSTSMLGIPAIIITILGATGALSTSLSLKFNLRGTKNKMEKTISNLNKIKSKLEYIINCNGDLSEDEYLDILKEFELY